MRLTMVMLISEAIWGIQKYMIILLICMSVINWQAMVAHGYLYWYKGILFVNNIVVCNFFPLFCLTIVVYKTTISKLKFDTKLVQWNYMIKWLHVRKIIAWANMSCYISLVYVQHEKMFDTQTLLIIKLFYFDGRLLFELISLQVSVTSQHKRCEHLHILKYDTTAASGAR